MRDGLLTFCLGLVAGYALKTILDKPRRGSEDAQIDRPRGASTRDWDLVDEQGYESFPASDPPGNY